MDRRFNEEEKALLIWTTTPWTLPSNMAIAAHPEFDYAKIKFIRRIQQMRKDMKLNVEQYIDIEVGAEEYLNKLFSTWKDFITGEVRAKTLTFADIVEGDGAKIWDITGKNVSIRVTPQ